MKKVFFYIIFYLLMATINSCVKKKIEGSKTLSGIVQPVSDSKYQSSIGGLFFVRQGSYNFIGNAFVLKGEKILVSALHNLGNLKNFKINDLIFRNGNGQSLKISQIISYNLESDVVFLKFEVENILGLDGLELGTSDSFYFQNYISLISYEPEINKVFQEKSFKPSWISGDLKLMSEFSTRKGHSGSPVLNSAGQVIGVHLGKTRQSEIVTKEEKYLAAATPIAYVQQEKNFHKFGKPLIEITAQNAGNLEKETFIDHSQILKPKPNPSLEQALRDLSAFSATSFFSIPGDLNEMSDRLASIDATLKSMEISLGILSNSIQTLTLSLEPIIQALTTLLDGAANFAMAGEKLFRLAGAAGATATAFGESVGTVVGAALASPVLPIAGAVVGTGAVVFTGYKIYKAIKKRESFKQFKVNFKTLDEHIKKMDKKTYMTYKDSGYLWRDVFAIAGTDPDKLIYIINNSKDYRLVDNAIDTLKRIKDVMRKVEG